MEKVLCFRREQLPREWLGKEVALSLTDTAFAARCAVCDISYIERNEAEYNHEFKQIIPYCLVCWQNHFACYARCGSEARLHGLRSLGVGGHINPTDEADNLLATAENGLMREIREEFREIDLSNVDLRFHGVINEEHSEVGVMHIGLVFSLTSHADSSPQPARELSDLKWLNEEELRRQQLELWSKLAKRCIDDTTNPRRCQTSLK